MSIFNDVPTLIKEARRGMTQREFAEFTGATQSMISRYERGLSNPPAEIINRCMHIVHQRGTELPSAITADQLATQIKERLQAPMFDRFRVVIAQLIEDVTLGVAEKEFTLGNNRL